MNVTWKITDENGIAAEDTQSLWIAFDLDQDISNRIKTYSSSSEATPSPIASKLFGFPWVEEITVATRGLLIKRQSWVDFDIIAEPLKELISEHFNSSSPTTFEENPEPQVAAVEEYDLAEYSENEGLIVQFLAEEVNPQVASHGGKISFVKLEGTMVHLKMEGGCQGCGMAAVTLKEGVEKSLLERFDFISEVIDTTDHSSGIRPYL
ncbi:MAG: NifU family protein [Bdellovibrionales bacterium]